MRLSLIHIYYVLKDYQKTRILVLFDPSIDVEQSRQATYGKIAIGSGQFTGQGWTNGTMTQMPVSYTHLFPPVSMEQTRIRIGNGVRKLVERSIPEESRTDEMIDICLADFRAFYGEHMMNRTHPYEGIVSVLETLKENGVTVGVLSNKYDSAAKALIEHYFGDLVSITYGERPNIPRKPDPTSVLQLLDELGGDKKTTLYIGDSATDMQTAVNAGLTAIGVVWGFRSAEELRASGADALAYEPSDLLPLFEYGVPDVSKAEKALTGYGFKMCIRDRSCPARRENQYYVRTRPRHRAYRPLRAERRNRPVPSAWSAPARWIECVFSA